MGVENGVCGYVDDCDCVVCWWYCVDVCVVGFCIVYGDCEWFVDIGDGLGDLVGVGVDDWDGVGVVVGYY